MAILENNNSIDEKIDLNHGLQTLRSSNRFLLNPIGKSELDNNASLEQYLLRPFWGEGANQEADKEFEKSVMTAVILSRSRFTPIDVAKARAAAAVEELRNAKIVTQHENNALTSKQFEKLTKDNWVSNTITRVRRTKRFLKRKGIRYGLSATLALAGVPAAAVVTFAGLLVWDILPTRTKTKIKEGAKKIVAKSKETIVNALTTLKEKGERIVERVTENIATGIARVEEMAKPVVEKVKDVVKAGCEIVTSIPVVEKTVEKAKHVLAKIKSWF